VVARRLASFALVGCGSDYLRPNTAGYAVLADSFFGAISAYLP